MSKILISKSGICTEENKYIIDIDLDNIKWKLYSPNLLIPFNIEEIIRPLCGPVYKDGVYPGGTRIKNTEKQTSKVFRFPNYLEFSKIVEDEVIINGSDMYITSLFFDRRKEGWSNINISKKIGKVVGYCFNGTLYNKEDIENVNKIVYHTVYLSIISKKKEFVDLIEQINSGITVRIYSNDELFFTAFTEAVKYTVLR